MNEGSQSPQSEPGAAAPSAELCKKCKQPVLMMTRKGTGICGQSCEESDAD